MRLSTCSNVCILTDYPFTLAADGQAPAGFDFAWARAMSTLPQTLPADTRVELGYQHNQLQLRAERVEGGRSLRSSSMRWRGRVRQARARGKRHHPDRPGAGQRWLAGDAPDLRGQSLGLLLTSGEQAWQTRATIADPSPCRPRGSHFSGCWGRRCSAVSSST